MPKSPKSIESGEKRCKFCGKRAVRMGYKPAEDYPIPYDLCDSCAEEHTEAYTSIDSKDSEIDKILWRVYWRGQEQADSDYPGEGEEFSEEIQEIKQILNPQSPQPQEEKDYMKFNKEVADEAKEYQKAFQRGFEEGLEYQEEDANMCHKLIEAKVQEIKRLKITNMLAIKEFDRLIACFEKMPDNEIFTKNPIILELKVARDSLTKEIEG